MVEVTENLLYTFAEKIVLCVQEKKYPFYILEHFIKCVTQYALLLISTFTVSTLNLIF